MDVTCAECGAAVFTVAGWADLGLCSRCGEPLTEGIDKRTLRAGITASRIPPLDGGVVSLAPSEWSEAKEH